MVFVLFSDGMAKLLHDSGITHARLAVRWVRSAELPNSTGALSPLSESFIFPMVFNVFQEVAKLSSVDDRECRSLLCETF